MAQCAHFIITISEWWGMANSHPTSKKEQRALGGHHVVCPAGCPKNYCLRSEKKKDENIIFEKCSFLRPLNCSHPSTIYRQSSLYSHHSFISSNLRKLYFQNIWKVFTRSFTHHFLESTQRVCPTSGNSSHLLPPCLETVTSTRETSHFLLRTRLCPRRTLEGWRPKWWYSVNTVPRPPAPASWSTAPVRRLLPAIVYSRRFKRRGCLLTYWHTFLPCTDCLPSRSTHLHHLVTMANRRLYRIYTCWK